MASTDVNIVGLVASLATAALFAFGNVYHRRASRHVKGRDATALTLAVNALMFLVVGVVYAIAEGASMPAFRSWPWVLGVSFFGLVAGRLGMYNTIMLVGPSRASAVKNTAPLFTLAAAFVVWRSTPSALAMLGVVLIIGGVWVYSIEKPEDRPAVASSPAHLLLSGRSAVAGLSRQRLGLLLGIAVAIAYAVADVMRVLALESTSVIPATVGASMGGWLLVMVFLLARGEVGDTYARSSGRGRADLSKAAFFMGLGQLTNFVAVSSMFVGYVAALVATAPLFTALLSGIMERDDERFGRSFWMGTAMLLPGAALINFAG